MLVIVLSSLLLAGCIKPKNEPSNTIQLTKTGQNQNQSQPSSTNQESESMKSITDYTPIAATQVTLVTSKGEIAFTLFRDKAPLTTLNFLTLAKEGFYDGLVFHRVIADFMAQVGDPLTREPARQAEWGTGGAGYVIADEFHPNLKHDKAGMVSMANRGPNTGGSQFFITYEPTPWLDGKHAIFGEVISGMDVLEQIQVGDTIQSVRYQ